MPNAGIDRRLFDEKHRKRMGPAVWLFGWCVGAQTRRSGLVLGGMPLDYSEMAKRTGFKPRSIEKWLSILKRAGYVEVTYTAWKLLRIRVLNQKKFTTKQSAFDFQHPEEKKQKHESISRQSAGRVPANQRDIARQSAGSNKSLSMSSNETPEEERQKTAAAFSGIGYDQFGQKAFQEVWGRRFASRGEWLSLAMEETIQECQERHIGIPPQFYRAKHDTEKEEWRAFENRDALAGKYHAAPT